MRIRIKSNENQNEKSQNTVAGKSSKVAISSTLELHLLLPCSCSCSQIFAFLYLDLLDLHDPLAAHLFNLRYQSVAFVESGNGRKDSDKFSDAASDNSERAIVVKTTVDVS